MICRWFQFSLRGLLVTVSLFAVWLGSNVERARKQSEAVKVIEAMGGIVQYDWQGDVGSWETVPEAYLPSGYAPPQRLMPDGVQPPTPVWLRSLLGEHLFQNVNGVILRTRQSRYFKNEKNGSMATLSEKPDAVLSRDIEAAMPQLHRLANLRAIYLQGDAGAISQGVEARLKVGFPDCVIVREKVITSTPN